MSLAFALRILNLLEEHRIKPKHLSLNTNKLQGTCMLPPVFCEGPAVCNNAITKGLGCLKKIPHGSSLEFVGLIWLQTPK